MAEKEYIERETAVLSLLDKGQHSRRYKLGEIWELDFEEIREAINSIPAADVRPVVRGQWIAVASARGGHECSVCHEYAPSFQNGVEHITNFCPNCGADMRGEADEKA